MDDPLSSLWGATIDEISIDIAAQALTITCHVSEGTRSFDHRIECKSLSEFRFSSVIPGQWKYAELTEIHVNETPSAEIQLEAVIWSEDAGLTIKAGVVQSDDKALVG